MFIFNSSIGKKFVQAVSGAFLIIFLLLHTTINFFSVIDSCTGKFGAVAADDKLFSAGDGLFKLGCDFMSTPVISILVPVLALGFLVHIIYGCWLTWKNIKARGGYKRYEVKSRAATDSWSARNMFVLGLLIILGIAVHLTHGFWSMFQTVGWDGSVWFKRIKVIGVIVATLICVLLAVVAVNGFIEARMLA